MTITCKKVICGVVYQLDIKALGFHVVQIIGAVIETAYVGLVAPYLHRLFFISLRTLPQNKNNIQNLMSIHIK